MELLEIIQSYKKGTGLVKLARKCHKRVSYIREILKEEKVPLRTKSQATRRISVDEDFFEIIDSEGKAYWLGFIAADGCVYSHPTKSVYQLRLSLAKKDLQHLLLFRSAIKSGHLLYYRTRHKFKKVTTSVGLAISSPKLFSDLINKGVVPRKSLVLKPPKNVPENLIHHWIRGYFDGDGSITLKRGKYLGVYITGTKAILEFILIHSDIKANIFKRKSKALHCSIGKQKEVEKFKNYIYKNATIYLERKRDKFYGP